MRIALVMVEEKNSIVSGRPRGAAGPRWGAIAGDLRWIGTPCKERVWV